MTHVVLTRAEVDANRQLDLLSASGFAATALPLMAIEPVAIDASVAPDLADSDMVIFTSANAVTYGLGSIDAACRRVSTCVLAVGKKTKELLGDQGIDAESPEREDSEGLLALLGVMESARSQSPNRIALVKGEGGRDLISSVLAERGFSVVEVNCYRRVWPPVSRSSVLAALKSQEPRCIHVASGETLSRLEELCDLYGVSVHDRHTLILPSDRVERQARELGWQSRIVAVGASDDALIAVLSTLS